MTRLLPLLLCAGLLLGCTSPGETEAGARNERPAARGKPVVLFTDFGLQDDAVGLMRGVILTRAPNSPLVDLTHEVPRFDVRAGSRLLGEAPGLYPPGSVFVVVVDPGVGTQRRAIVARLPNGTLLVAPDNGVLSEALRRHGPAEVREVINRNLLLPARSATFHGRDVFAPVGGSLAGGVEFEKVGPLISDYERLEPKLGRVERGALFGTIEAIDEPFGNVWTNLPADWLERARFEVGDQLEVTFDEVKLTIPLCNTFGDVERGLPLVYPNSRGRVALALNMGDFARKHRIEVGATIEVRKTR